MDFVRSKDLMDFFSESDFHRLCITVDGVIGCGGAEARARLPIEPLDCQKNEGDGAQPRSVRLGGT